MANISDDQMRQTRDALLDMADSLKTLKKKKGNQLSDEEIKKIDDAIADTLDKASAANAGAIQDTVDNIKTCVCKIEDAKKTLSDAVKNLNKCKNVLTVATNVVKLASAVAGGNVQTIISAAGAVIGAANA